MKRLVKISIAVIVVAVLALWVSSRWDAWFYNVPEEPYAAASVPDRITLTSGEDFMSERTVSWRCGDSVKPSKLVLASEDLDTVSIEAKGTVVQSRGGLDAFYVASMDSLQAGYYYSYRVETEGYEPSEWHWFKMPDKEQVRRSFLFFGDVQDTLGGNSGQWFAKLYKKYPEVEFWACAGDLIERPIDAYWNYLYESADSILASMPLFNATGNHDYIKSLYRKADPRWKHTFVYPDNGATTAKGISYYVDFPDMRFIVIDTDGLQDAMTLAGCYKWLRSCLREADDKWKVVMYHHPAYSVRKDRNNYLIRNTFVPLFDKYGVDLVLQGHEHGYMRVNGNEGEEKRPVYIVSYMSPKSYKARELEQGLKVIADTRMYQVVEYDDSKLVFNAYSLDTDSILDHVEMKK